MCHENNDTLAKMLFHLRDKYGISSHDIYSRQKSIFVINVSVSLIWKKYLHLLFCRGYLQHTYYEPTQSPHYTDLSEGIGYIKHAYRVYFAKCLSKIKAILSIVFDVLYECVFFQLIHFWWLWECVHFVLLSSPNRMYEPIDNCSGLSYALLCL